MAQGFRITIRNENDEIIEYHTAQSVLHLDVPEGRYVITVSADALDPGAEDVPVRGTLQ